MTQSSRGTSTAASTDSAPSALTPSDSDLLQVKTGLTASTAAEQSNVAAMSREDSVPVENSDRQAEPVVTTSGRTQKSSGLRRTLQWVSIHRRESAAAVLVLIMLGIFADGQSERSGSSNADQADELQEVEELLADFGTETKAFVTPETAASNQSDTQAGSPLEDGSSLTIPITPGAGAQASGTTTDAPAFGSDSGSYPNIASSDSVVADGQGTLNISAADYANGTGALPLQVPADQQSIATSASVDGATSNSVPPGSPSAPRNRVSQIRFRGEIRPIRQ